LIATLAAITAGLLLFEGGPWQATVAFKHCGVFTRDNCVVDGDTFRFQGERSALASGSRGLSMAAIVPLAGPEAVLRYLSRYTHRVAISNRRLVADDDNGVSFRCTDYRIDGLARCKTMTLTPFAFIRRFLIHVLPRGFHRIRHYGLFANGNRAANVARARELLGWAPPELAEEAAASAEPDNARVQASPCPCCGGRMLVIEVFARSPAAHAANTDHHQDQHLMKFCTPPWQITARRCWSAAGDSIVRTWRPQWRMRSSQRDLSSPWPNYSERLLGHAEVDVLSPRSIRSPLATGSVPPQSP
jgi:hypothetical protein